MNKAYNKITWQNKPSTATPLNQTNLNEMSNALDTIDDRVIALDSGKVSSVTVTNTLPTGDTIATITVDGTATNIKSAQVEVDAEPSATSENPLQNKAIYEMLNNLLPEETVQGNPIAISDASGLNAKACSVGLLPIQDLHGYDSPWDGGAGKNLLPMTVTGLKSANVNGTWSGNVFTLNNVSFTILTDSDENVTGIKLDTGSGGASGDVVFYLSNSNSKYFTLTQGTSYILTADGATSNIGVRVGNSSDGLVGQAKPNALTFTADSKNTARIGINVNGTASNLIIKPMIRLATVTDATFAPYTNICPISGRNSVTLTVNGEDTEITFGQTVYGGTLDVTNGKLTIDKAIVTYVGNEGWSEHASGGGRFYVNGKPSGIDISKRGQNDLFKCNTRSYIMDKTGYGAYIFYGSAGLYCSKKDANETLSDFTTALSTTNMQVTYPLATPIELTLTPEEISLLKGNNTLTTDGNSIKLVYSADIGLYIAGQLQNS